MVEFPMTVRPPEPGSFNQPNLSAWLANSIGNLPNQYQQGFENQRKREMMNAFPEGPPLNPDGTINQKAITQKAFQLGGIEYAKPLLNLIMENQFTQEALKQVSGQDSDPYAGVGGGQPQPVPGVGPRADSTTPAPPTGETLRTLAAGIANNQDVTPVISEFARKNRISPESALSEDQERFVRGELGRSIPEYLAKQRQGQPQTIASASPGAIPVRTTSYRPPGQEVDTAAGGPSAPAVVKSRPLVPGATGTANISGFPPQQSQPPQQQPRLQQQAQAQQPPVQGGLPQAGAPTSTTASLPPEQQLQAARNMERLSQTRFQQAAAVARFNPKMADQLKAEGEMWAGRAKQIYEQHAKTNEPTPEQKTAASMGMNPLQLKQAEKYGTDLMDQSKKKYAGIDAQAAQYERNLKPHLQQLSAIVNDPQFQAGLGSNIALTINKARAMFGDTKAALLQEAFKKITAQSVLAQINDQKFEIEQAGGTGGRIFAQQVDLVTQASPLLENTPAGTRYLGQFAMRMGDISAKVAQMARDYIKQHTRNGIPGVLDPGFDQQVSDYLAKNPIFSEQELSHPEILGAPQAPPRIKTEQELAQWGRSMSLKPGDPVRSPDGKKVTPLPALKAP